MTQQYQQRSINEQGSSIAFVATVAVPDVTLQPAVQMAIIDETLSASVATLPGAAAAGQNAQVTVVNLTGSNGVTVAADVAAGDALLASAGFSNPVVGTGDTMTFRSDGISRWIAVGQTV